MLHIAKPNIEGAGKLLQECVDTNWISSQGPFVKQFEVEFAEWLGVKHAVSCSSGTAALHLALKALGIGPGDKVLVPSFTFIATVNSVVYCGAEPVFCDVTRDDWCIDFDDACLKTDKKVKAMIPVHINGYTADTPTNGPLLIVEDACQALGSTWNDLKLGTLGQVGCFSFFPNKQLTTGEGGMAVTNDNELDTTMRMLRDHGRAAGEKGYIHKVVGFNYRMTNLQAAVGLVQLRRLDHEVARRKVLHENWRKALGNTQPYNPEQCPWLYHYRMGSELETERAIAALAKVGIESKPFYIPCHKQRPYDDGNTHLPVAESLHGIMLPLHDGVTDEHISLVKETLATAITV